METAADMTTLEWALADEPRSRADRRASVIRRGEALPWWLDSILTRIQELAELEGLNPQSERPLNVEDVRDALRFLDRVMGRDTYLPSIGRLSSGGVAMAWKHGDVEVEAVFDRLRGDRELLVSVGDRDWDAPADKGDSLFASVVERLSNSYIEHAAGAPAPLARA